MMACYELAAILSRQATENNAESNVSYSYYPRGGASPVLKQTFIVMLR